MNQQFRDLVDTLDKKYQALMSMDPVIADKIQPNTPVGGVYLFSEEEGHLYAGRTKRKISVRIRNHFNSAKDCPFAWLLARHKTGKKASYKKEGSRADLLLKREMWQSDHSLAIAALRERQWCDK